MECSFVYRLIRICSMFLQISSKWCQSEAKSLFFSTAKECRLNNKRTITQTISFCQGYEWNKYNQTHYDMDNPPPKIVQGYKFNVSTGVLSNRCLLFPSLGQGLWWESVKPYRVWTFALHSIKCSHFTGLGSNLSINTLFE